MFTANLLPGQGFQPFTVYRENNNVTSTGRAMKGTVAPTDITMLGILIRANQQEKEQWKQAGHPITHTIVEYSAMKKAKATDYLVAADGREFYVQGTKNPGDLNVTMIYYVEERQDIKKVQQGGD